MSCLTSPGRIRGKTNFSILGIGCHSPCDSLEDVHELPLSHILVSIQIRCCLCAPVSFYSYGEEGVDSLGIFQKDSAVHLRNISEICHYYSRGGSEESEIAKLNDTLDVTTC